VFIHTHAVLLWSQVRRFHLLKFTVDFGSRVGSSKPCPTLAVSLSRINQTGRGYVYNIEPSLAPTAARPRSASQSGPAPAVPLQSLRPLLILKRAGDGACKKCCHSVQRWGALTARLAHEVSVREPRFHVPFAGVCLLAPQR